MKNISHRSFLMLAITTLSIISVAQSVRADTTVYSGDTLSVIDSSDSLSVQDQNLPPLYPVKDIPNPSELLIRKTPASSQEFKADKEIKWDRLNFSLDLIENAYVKNNLNVAYARGSINVKYHQEKQETTKEMLNVIDTVKLNDGVRFKTANALGSGENGIWSVADHMIRLSGENTTLQVTSNNLTIIAQKYFNYNTISGLFQAVGSVRAISDGRTVQAHQLNTKISPIDVLKTGKIGTSEENTSQDDTKTDKKKTDKKKTDENPSKITINEIHAIGNVKINTDAQRITGNRATFNIKSNIVKVDGHARIIRYPTLEEIQAYKNKKDKEKATKPENRIIMADHIVGYLTKNNGGKSTQGIDKVTAIGHVKYQNANQTVIGSRALYHPKRSEAFIYDVIAYRGGDSLKACMAYINLKTTLTEIGPCDRKYGKHHKNNHAFNRKLRKKGKKVDSKDQVVIDLTVDPANTKELNKSLHKQLPLPDFNIN